MKWKRRELFTTVPLALCARTLRLPIDLIKKRKVLLGTFLIAFVLCSFTAFAVLPGFIQFPSHGEIGNATLLTVYLRDLTVGYSDEMYGGDIERYVDEYVANHAFGDRMIVAFGDLYSMEGILRYGYEFTKTSGTWGANYGWTFNDLKRLIDRFHYHGWKVHITTTGIAWYGQWTYNYITTQHPELKFTNYYGQRNNPDVPDYFAQYATADTNLGIPAGSRLIDVYCTRLKQMIVDGLKWDGWFGTDGWNGINIQGFSYSPDWLDGYYSFSSQEIDEWANEAASYGFGVPNFPPSGWNTWTNVQKASWIGTNAPSSWFHYWSLRWAKMYKQIKDAIKAGNPDSGDIVTVVVVDYSSQWHGSGNLGPAGMMNFTMLAQEESFDAYFVDQEHTYSDDSEWADLAKEQAYTAGLIRSKHPSIRAAAGIQESAGWWESPSRPVPLWALKQQYIAQAQAYVWINGVRYRAVDPNIIFVQNPSERPYSSGGYAPWSDEVWDNNIVKTFFNWVKSMHTLFARNDLTPVYLGPAIVIPETWDGWEGPVIGAFNYTFAQFLDNLNFRRNATYLSSDIKSIFISMGSVYLSSSHLNRALDLYAKGDLNLIFYRCGPGGAVFSSNPAMEAKAEATFALSQSDGSTNLYSITNAVTDPYGAWIVSGYEGRSYQTPDAGWRGTYIARSGFIPLATFADNRIAMGIYYNSTSARFLYGTYLSGNQYQYQIIVPRDVLNKAIYWASNSPVNMTQPLLDLKVFKLIDGTIIIPMMNHKDMASNYQNDGTTFSSLISLDAFKLGLGNPDNYVLYWQSDLIQKNISSWTNIPITLNGMADILVIEPK